MKLLRFDEYAKEHNVQVNPKLHKKSLDDELLPMLKEQFLNFFRQTGSIDEAAESIGVSTAMAIEWRKTDSDFGKSWDAIRENELIPLLEEAAFRRALSGKSDLMLIFLLKSMKPDKYDDRLREPPQQPSIILRVTDLKGNSLIQSKKTETIDVDE